MAKGAIVNTKKSLLLCAERTKTIAPIKKAVTVCLYAVCVIDGRLDSVKNIEKTKNKATET